MRQTVAGPLWVGAWNAPYGCCYLAAQKPKSVLSPGFRTRL